MFTKAYTNVFDEVIKQIMHADKESNGRNLSPRGFLSII